MKNNNLIIGLNLIVLFIFVLFFQIFDADGNFIFCVLSLIILAIINLVNCIIYFRKGDKPKAQSFVLSGLLVLIIGSSSCVSIKFRNKDPKTKQIAPKENTNPKDTTQLQQK